MGRTSNLIDEEKIKILLLHKLKHEAEEITELLGRGVSLIERFLAAPDDWIQAGSTESCR